MTPNELITELKLHLMVMEDWARQVSDEAIDGECVRQQFSADMDRARDLRNTKAVENGMEPSDRRINEIARAICRVQLNGGDPDQPAIRWNGTEIEPQEFPAWRDYIDEAVAANSALGLIVENTNEPE